MAATTLGMRLSTARTMGCALALLSGCEGTEKVIYVDREVVVQSEDTDSDPGSNDDPNGAADADGDGYAADDCDDANPDVNPGTVETCNGIDDDCDGTIDDVGVPPTWYPDADGDGFADPGDERFVGCDGPEGFVTATGDCDDTRADVYPGADPVCEAGVDGDCDGSADFADGDGDGFLSCDDCDDSDAAVHPGATEWCNGIDDDCDTVADGESAVDAVVSYADTDGDGWGDSDSEQWLCAVPSGHVAQGGDCDDGDPAVHPAADEICDSIDNDCDRTVDEADAVDASFFYVDFDGDGYGEASSIRKACAAPSGYVATADDCDDRDPLVHPGAVEVCGGADEDCNGLTDDEDSPVSGTSTFYADTDGDTYGDAAATTQACDAPSGFVSDNTDCDDSTTEAYPGASEYCDSIDNDCDGTVDENSAVDAVAWYLDADGDGWGSTSTTVSCSQPTGYVAASGDCDDAVSTISPSAVETWYDGVDSDCAGDSDYDADGDGYDSDAYSGTDCDDTEASTHPGATEWWYDGVDGDCAGDNDYDADGDGYDSDGFGGTDCDDDDATVNVDATDRWYDGIDQDCDGRSDYDADFDGFDSDAYGGDDCDDTDELFHPYAWEDDADGLDNDCDGYTDTADPDVPYEVGLGRYDDGEARVSITTGYSFPFCGSTHSRFHLNGNGLITFDAATSEFYESVAGLTSTHAPAIAIYWDDFDLSDNTDSDAWIVEYSDAVGVYFRNAEEYYGITTNDFGVVLFEDGRILWDFGSMTAYDGLVGWACGTGTGTAVDWSDERMTGVEGLPTIGQGTEDAMYQLFTTSDPMDLGESTIWSCGTAGNDNDGDGWTDLCGDPDDTSAAVTP